MGSRVEQGCLRIWRDDTLIFDHTDVPAITVATGMIDYFYLFTYWNDETPPVSSWRIATHSSST